jgi:hypothetical protein
MLRLKVETWVGKQAARKKTHRGLDLNFAKEISTFDFH